MFRRGFYLISSFGGFPPCIFLFFFSFALENCQGVMLGSVEWRAMFVTRTFLNKATQSFGSSPKPALESNEGGSTKEKKRAGFTRNSYRCGSFRIIRHSSTALSGNNGPY